MAVADIHSLQYRNATNNRNYDDNYNRRNQNYRYDDDYYSNRRKY